MYDDLWKTLAKSGPIAIVAGVLLWFFIGDVQADQKSTRAEHAEFRGEQAKLRGDFNAQASRMENLMGQVLMSQERAVYLMRRQCINTAKSQAERDACSRDRE